MSDSTHAATAHLAVTGSTGHVGRLVADLLGDRVDRLVLRDPSRAPDLPSNPEVVQAAYGDASTARAALEGVEVLFMVSGAESPTRRQEHRTFIAAAADAGVRHIVYTSFAGAAQDAVFTLGRDHWDAEEAIRESGMEFTLLRDNFYADFFPMFADEQGVIRGPAGHGRVAAVSRADVAAVAAAVLSDPEAHVDRVYTLTGPEAITMHEAVETMSRVLDRPISFVDETVEEAYESRRQWSNEQWQLDAWVSTYTAIRDGTCAEVSPDVERITGQPAQTFEQAVASTLDD